MNVTRVQESLSLSPSRSLWQRSQQLGISVSSFRHILIKDLKFFLYTIKHQLTQADVEKKVAMSKWFLWKLNDNEEFLNDVWF